MKRLLISLIIITIISIGSNNSMVLGQIPQPVPQMEDTTAHAPTNPSPANKNDSEKEPTINGVNDDTVKSMRGSIIKEGGMEYIIVDNQKFGLLKGTYFPSSICRLALIDVSINITLTLNASGQLQGNIYLCMEIWENDWPDGDDFVKSTCKWVSHTAGVDHIHVQHTFSNVDLTPRIEEDPGSNGEFYIKIDNNYLSNNWRSEDENVSICGEILDHP